jgi:hypothetical protein
LEDILPELIDEGYVCSVYEGNYVIDTTILVNNSTINNNIVHDVE